MSLRKNFALNRQTAGAGSSFACSGAVRMHNYTVRQS